MPLPFPVELKDLQNAILKSQLTEKDYDSQDFFILKTCFTLLTSMQDLINHIEVGGGFFIESEKDWARFIRIYDKSYKSVKRIFNRYLKRLEIDKWDQEELVGTILKIAEFIKSGFYDNQDEIVYFYAVILSGKIFTSVFYYNYLINEACDKKIDSLGSLYNTRKNLASIKKERLWIEDTYNRFKNKEIDEVPEEIKEKLFFLWDRTFNFLKELEDTFSKSKTMEN